jgi:nitrite reductase/ring-hydroxylating ferredoxin subunit
MTQAGHAPLILCALDDLADPGSRSFSIGEGDWPLRGFLVRRGAQVFAYINRCPHAGHPLNLRLDRFLTADGALILCNSHGAMFEIDTGVCVAGPCPGQSLRRIPVRVENGQVVLDEGERSLSEWLLTV